MRHSLLSAVLMLVSIYTISSAFAENNVITVYYNKEIGPINKRVFGNNFLGVGPVDPIWPSYYYSRADYGLGIWNPQKNE